MSTDNRKLRENNQLSIQDKLKNSLFKFVLIFCLFGLIIFSCNQDKDPLSKFCIKIEKIIPKDTLTKFYNRLENDRSHSDYYYLFKENILEELEKNKELKEIFSVNGIKNESDKAYTLFIALHRRNNNKKIYFDSLLIETKNDRIMADKSRKESIECKKDRKIIAEENYKRIEKGDLIELSYPFKIGPNNHKNAFLYSCPSSYLNSEDNYVFLSGKVKNKHEHVNNDTSKSFSINIIVNEISDKSIPILMQWKSKDSILHVELESYGREIIKSQKKCTEQSAKRL